MKRIKNVYDLISFKASIILIMFLSLLILHFPSYLYAQECVGDYVLTSQSEVDNFNCTSVTGSLLIYEAVAGSITNLNELAALTSIGRLNLYRNAALANIDGLAALTTVGNVKIYGNAALTNIDGLAGLTSVNDLRIEENAALTNIDGLAALTSIEDDLWVLYNAALTDIDGLAALTSIGKRLTLSGNAALTNIDGLAALTSAESVNIYGNAALTNIDGLAGLTSVMELYIEDNAALTNIDGLAALTSAESVNIYGNAALTNIDGLAGLTSVMELYIEDNAALTNIDGLAALTSIGLYLNIAGNASLTNLDGLAALTSIECGLNILNNDALTNLDGLAALTSIGKCACRPKATNLVSLLIVGNDSLTNIDGLAALTSIRGSLYIAGNAVLANLDGLAALKFVGTSWELNEGGYDCSPIEESIYIIDNAALMKCCGLYPLLTVGTVEGEIEIEDNYTGCNSIEEILNAGPCCNLDSKFKETNIIDGVEYYTDRGYTLTSVPSDYAGMNAIITPNDDRNLTTASDYLTFEMPYDGTVYVAFDSRAISKPSWMNGFIDTSDVLLTSLSTQPFLKIYSKMYYQGDCVNFGANKASGFVGDTVSNYIVLYGAGGPPATCTLASRFAEKTLYYGMTYYTDRAYTLTSVPSAYAGMDAILTPNDDRDMTTSTGYLTVEMPYDGTVYVAFDSRAISEPSWMNGFIDTGDVLLTSLSTQPSLKIYSKIYDEGDCVNFGANKAPGFVGGTVSNYIVFYSDGNIGPGDCTLDTKFEISTMAIGAYYYTDRDYMITGGVPSWMLGRMLIRPPNDDRFNEAASGYIRFTNTVDWWVYVLFDSRSSSIPTWLNGWELRSEKITTSLATQPYLKMYRKMFDAGQCVDLGGNYGPGSSTETRSNYAVVYGK